MTRDQRISGASILAIISAVAGLIVDAAAWKLVLAIAAMLIGIVGFVLAASPRVRGGFISLGAIGLGLLAFVIGVFDVFI